jgi:hypothetical protein
MRKRFTFAAPISALKVRPSVMVEFFGNAS